MFQIFYYARHSREALASLDVIPDSAMDAYPVPPSYEVAIACQSGSGNRVLYGYDGAWREKQPEDWSTLDRRAVEAAAAVKRAREKQFIAECDVRLTMAREAYVEVTLPISGTSARRAHRLTWDELRQAASFDDEAGALYLAIETAAKSHLATGYLAIDMPIR
jgi:hypothetical protein